MLPLQSSVSELPKFGLLHSAQIQIFFPMKEAIVRTPYSDYKYQYFTKPCIHLPLDLLNRWTCHFTLAPLHFRRNWRPTLKRSPQVGLKNPWLSILYILNKHEGNLKYFNDLLWTVLSTFLGTFNSSLKTINHGIRIVLSIGKALQKRHFQKLNFTCKLSVGQNCRKSL